MNCLQSVQFDRYKLIDTFLLLHIVVIAEFFMMTAFEVAQKLDSFFFSKCLISVCVLIFFIGSYPYLRGV